MNVIITALMALSIGLTGTTSQAPSQAPTNALSQVIEAQAPHIPHMLTRCEEDMPCWDCHTMGNLICGPLTQAPVEAPAQDTITAPETATVSPVQPIKVPVTYTQPIVAPAPVKAPVQPTVQPVKPAAMPVAPVQPVQPAVCEEDMDCWDCDTMGNLQCGTPEMGDAWESFDAVDIDYSTAHPLTYTSTEHVKPKASAETVVVKSINLPKTWHIFTYKNS